VNLDAAILGFLATGCLALTGAARRIPALAARTYLLPWVSMLAGVLLSALLWAGTVESLTRQAAALCALHGLVAGMMASGLWGAAGSGLKATGADAVVKDPISEVQRKAGPA